MAFLKDKSAGVILFKERNKKIKVLVVKQKAGHFSLPKGHKKLQEKDWQTAFRELKEETGIEDVCILLSERLKENYKFKKNNRYYRKKVVYFVGYYKGGKVKKNISYNKRNDVVKSFWVDVNNIKKYLFPSTQSVVKKGLKIFRKIYERS